ncbi:MAG: TIGR03067 domain-containing protein [Gemmataceae bacterium]|nr:TIGR03067 domain-containing protein [Gemmataceae bacterium]
MTRAPAALAALVLAAAAASADEKAMLKSLEGTYKITTAEKGGKSAPKELTDTATIVFKGDEFVIAFGEDKKVAKIKVGGDDKLATIDLMPQDGAEKGKMFPGVYKLDKGDLTLVFTEKEKADRPKFLPSDKDFKADDDTIVLKLKKSDK